MWKVEHTAYNVRRERIEQFKALWFLQIEKVSKSTKSKWWWWCWIHCHCFFETGATHNYHWKMAVKTSLNFSKRPLSNSTSDHVMYVANGHCYNGEIERLFFARISPSFNCSLCYYYSSDAHFDTQYPVEPSCDARRIRAYGSDRFALRVCRVVVVVTCTRLYAAVRSTLSLKATKSPPCRPRQKKNFFHVKCMETRP